jgi:hypothetical protein
MSGVAVLLLFFVVLLFFSVLHIREVEHLAHLLRLAQPPQFPNFLNPRNSSYLTKARQFRVVFLVGAG